MESQLNVRHFHFTPGSGLQSIVTSMSVYQSVCPRAISETTRAIFAIFAQVAYGSGSIFFRRRCDVWLVAWHSGRTSVFGRRTVPVLRSTCSWPVTSYVGKPSAIGQPTRPTQPFMPSGR